MKDFLKRSGYVSLVTSLVFALLGIIIILNPSATLNFISTIIGIATIIIGIIKFFNCFSNKDDSGKLDISKLFGTLIIIIAGIVVICYNQTIQSIIGIVVGLWIIYSSLIKFGFSIQIKTLSFPTFLVSLILSIAMFICGIYILFNASALVVSFGVIMLIFAIMDIIEEFLFISYTDKL